MLQKINNNKIFHPATPILHPKGDMAEDLKYDKHYRKIIFDSIISYQRLIS